LRELAIDFGWSNAIIFWLECVLILGIIINKNSSITANVEV
jgi:hypothetical protein